MEKYFSLWENMSVEEEIGYGAYGTVYRVSANGQTYAMKQIRLSAPDHGEYGRVSAEQLLEEIRILQRFRNHPNIVAICDYRMTESPEGYDIDILMEALEPLEEYEVTHALGEKEVIRLGLDLCRALEACEQAGVLHRDLKPENILVAEDGTFKLCDFGTARNLERTTASYSVKGTFSTMAPEVYHGEKYDHRADIYSLGILLYRLMNQGRDPFVPAGQRMAHAADQEEALARRMGGDPLPAPSEASEELVEVLRRACAYYPVKRYANASALREDLEKLQGGTYRKKNTAAGRFGKRKKSFYLRAALALAGLTAVLFLGGMAALYEYRERYVDYCDPEIRRLLEETYGCTIQARLTGNGTLYIENNEDQLCTFDNLQRYPWMNEKDRIRKIVFGENVTIIGILPPKLEELQTEFTASAGLFEERISSSEDIFKDCKNLKEVVIRSSSFNMYGGELFRGAEKLKRITCPAGADVAYTSEPLQNTPWAALPGYRMLGNMLVAYHGQKEIIDDIPPGTRRIGYRAFASNERIREVVVPEGVLSIGGKAFADCTSLESIVLPEGIETVDFYAFSNCCALDNLIIPSSITELSTGAFYGCGRLEHLELAPGNTAYILEEGALYDSGKTELKWCASWIKEFYEIPEGVKRADPEALSFCSGLRKLVIPSTFEYEFSTVFGYCESLTEIQVAPEHPQFSLRDSFLRSRDGRVLYFCLRDAEGCLEVPEGTDAILEYTFACCRKVTEVRVPEGVRLIFGNSFRDCTALRTLRLPESLTLFEKDSLKGCTTLTDIYFAGSQESWDRMVAMYHLQEDVEGVAVHCG